MNSNEIKLNFKQSIKLLKYIKKFKQLHLLFKNEFPNYYLELINKCNLVIYEKLALDKSFDDLIYYLNELHKVNDSDELNLKSIYPNHLLNTIESILIKNQLDLNSKFKICKLLNNFKKNSVVNENLFKFFYDLILNDKQLKLELNYSAFILFDLELPFIDNEKLANELLDTNNPEFKSKVNSKMNSIELFFKLILMNISINKELINYLFKEIENLDEQIYRKDRLKYIRLAKIYLNNNDLNYKLDKETKLRMGKKLDEMLIKTLRYVNQLNLSKQIYNLNNKIQSNSFLSNGFYLNEFVIYDKSINKLIPLTDYENYFAKIDQIKLNENQELNVFIHNNSKDLFYNQKLTKYLNSIGIRTIQVS